MRRFVVLVASASLFAACADDPPAEPDGPRVTGISKRRVVVGETVEFYGRGFAEGDAGTTRLRFEGEFIDDAGHRKPVKSFEITPVPDGTIGEGDAPQQVLRWSRFGPFGNPFDTEGRPGVFDGVVIAENIGPDGVVTPDTQPKRLQLEVAPSLLIEEFQPLEAQCKAPALRVLSGLPYRLKVRAVGIRPVRYEYEVANIGGTDGAARFTHDYADESPVATDDLGVNEAVIFNPVPEDDQFYVTGIRVIATDAQGRTVETAMPVSVHRPIEVVYTGTRELAERYEPVPVSGCIPGSTRSRVEYTESKSESRQRSVSVTVSRSFAESQGVGTGESWQEGISEGETRSTTLGGSETESETAEETYGVSYGTSTSNEVGFSSTDGETWGWNMSEGTSNEDYSSRMNELYGEGNWSGTVGVEGSGSIPGFAKVTGSASTTVGVRAGASTGTEVGQSRTDTSNRGWSMGGSHAETSTFGSTTTDSQSRSLSGTYALSRGRSTNFSDTEARSRTRTWTVDRDVSQERVATTGDEESVNRTVVSTETDETVQSYSGLIPNGKVGIFYRQTTRWVRRAEVRSYNLCGIARHVGELQFNDWTWAPDLAIGDTCDTQPPPSNLPPRACLVEPCGG
jgi:hypothetical protein